jgi:hypothetical protein
MTQRAAGAEPLADVADSKATNLPSGDQLGAPS